MKKIPQENKRQQTRPQFDQHGKEGGILDGKKKGREHKPFENITDQGGKKGAVRPAFRKIVLGGRVGAF